ncbi:hypothetical protein DENSPDRAFT_833780 [Dentipellis sp. KUC8613]|nr:hypothetical protein DENSPDRAFT_833780 [Dentipellis sp. KUC8613]
MADRNTGRPWTSREDELLSQAVASYGEAADWKTIALHVPGRTNKACRKRWLHSLSPDIKKSAWTKEEDETLLSLYAIHGTKWSLIARHIPGRTDDACSKRYREALDPSLKRAEWTPEEDRQLREIYGRIGGQWGRIGQEMQRSGLGCRNRWRLLERKCLAAAQKGRTSRPAPYPQNPQPPSTITTQEPQTTWMDFQTVDPPFPYWPSPMQQLNNNMADLQSHLVHSPPSMALPVEMLDPMAGGDTSTSQDMPPFCYQSSSSLSAALLTPQPSHLPNPMEFQLRANSASATQGSPASIHTSLTATTQVEPDSQEDPMNDDSNANLHSPNAASEIFYSEEPSQVINEPEALPYTSHSPQPAVPEARAAPTPSPARPASMSRSATPQREASPTTEAVQPSALPAPSPRASTSYYRSPNSPRRVMPTVQRRLDRQGPPPRLSSNLAASSDPSILAYSCGYPECMDKDGRESSAKFMMSKDLSDHVRQRHPSNNLDLKPFRCGLKGCGKGWKSVNGLQYHLQVSKAHFRQAITSLASANLQVKDSDAQPSSGDDPPVDANGKPKKRFPCPHVGCIHVYKQLGGLKYHLSHGHPPQLPAQLDSVPPVLARKVNEKFQKQATGP